MEIRVDGNRSTTESWLESHSIPLQDLPPLTGDEQAVVRKLSISPDDYRRSKYAADSTKKSLEGRAARVGEIVAGWLRTHEFNAEVQSVWLKTLDGKYRVDVSINGSEQLVFFSEELMDGILDSGSRAAQQEFDSLMNANFGIHAVAQAS